MFCHKCGNKLADGAAFCNKCGTKAMSVGIKPQPTSSVIVDEKKVVAEESSQQTSIATAVPVNNGNDFKQFVDNHIRKTTKFNSAEDLIMNSKPMSFIWTCIISLAVFGMIFGAIRGGIKDLFAGLLVFGGLFGFASLFIVSGIIRSKYRAKFSGKVEQKIDFEDFIEFLNKHLRIISPYFSDWGYLDRRGGMITILSNAVSNALKEVNLCCEYGENGNKEKQNLAVICIRPDASNPSSGLTQYFISATYNGSLIDGGASGLLAHSCLIKTAPILQAAIEYYVKNKK